MEPSFLRSGPQTVRAAPGSDASLVLPLPSGTPPFTYDWSRAGASLDDRFTVSEDTGGVRLTVTTARAGDSGLYTLQASNAAGKDTTCIRLEVSPDETPTGEDPPTFLRRLQDLTVKVGTRTRFLVEILSSTECKVTWYRNERRLMEAERVSLVRDGNFWCADVAVVSVDDAGRWTCTAENSGGRASCSAHLNVLVPKAYKRPEFVEELRALLTEQGTVSLECKVVGVPTPVLRWFKDSCEIKAGDVFALTANAEDPTSLGTYTCEAVNCMGRAYSSSKVHVVGRLTTEGSIQSASGLSTSITPEPPPIFTKELEDKFVKICEHLNLSCQIVVPPWPRSVVWYNKEGKVEPGERYHVLEDGVGGYLLEVPSAEWPDEGEWKCVATSSGGRVGISTCYVAMDVPKNYRKPRFMENLQAVLTEEGLVSFECKVVGFPTPVLSWFKDGQELKPGDVYQLTGTNSLGSYCCIAKNCMGQASSSAELTVEDIQNQLNEEEKLQLFSKNQAPKFLQGLKSVEAKIDEPFRFTIKVAIPPEPSVLWYRDDQPVDESTRCHLGKEERGSFYLDIQSLEFLDQAEWKCIAMNDFGHSVTSCFLKLIIPRHYKKPRFLENLQAVLSEEGAVNLECKVIGVPQPVLKWYKDGEELKPGDIHRIISGQDGTCCLGTYTCEAQNCMGIAASSASLLGFEDSMKAKSKTSEVALERNLSLSTIHEERTSQMYDTPVGDITLDDKGEISFSFDGKEVSVSLYETPDLTEEEALQIVEMYADQLSENVTEHNVVELPPLRFVKETSTSGNLLMEAIIIDVSPEYFVSPEEDLRTEADIEDISIADENGPPQLSLDQEIGSKDYLEKTMTILSDEKADIPKKIPIRKTDSLKSGDDYFSLSREQSLSENKDDETQCLSDSNLQSFASAHSLEKPNSKEPSFEEKRESIESAKSNLKTNETREKIEEFDLEISKPKRERRRSRSSRRSSSSSEKSLIKIKDHLGHSKDVAQSETDKKLKSRLANISCSLIKIIDEIQMIEKNIMLKSELMSSTATASRSIEITHSLITPLTEIQSIVEAAMESISESKEISSSLIKKISPSLKNLQQSLTIIEKCIDVESENKTLVKKTCVAFIKTCGNEVQNVVTALNNLITNEEISVEGRSSNEINILTNEIATVIKLSTDSIKVKHLLSEAEEIKLDESIESKHLRDTQKALFELKSPLESLMHIIENAENSEFINMEEFNYSDVILNDMAASIQDLQAALELVEDLSIKEATSSLNKFNTDVIETVMESIVQLRSSFEHLSTEHNKKEGVTVLKQVMLSLKCNLKDISSHIDKFENSIGKYDILQSGNNLEVLQKMAQILIILENNLHKLEPMPDIKTYMTVFHKNMANVLEKVIENNEAKKYQDFLQICNAINRINTSLKNIESLDTLFLVSFYNAMKIIQDSFINNLYEPELNCTILNNIADILFSLQGSLNRALEITIQMNSELVEEITSPIVDKPIEPNVVLEHLDHTITAISNIRVLETSVDIENTLAPALENLCPILEEIKRNVALNCTQTLQEEQVSDITTDNLLSQNFVYPTSELNHSIITLSQIIVENIEILKQSPALVPVLAEPVYELNKTLQILQQNILSQCDDKLTSSELSVNIAKAVQSLQSCIVVIREQAELEAMDEMSTLDDISAIKTTADIVSSDRMILPSTEEITIAQTSNELKQELIISKTAQYLHTLNEHIIVMHNPNIYEALDIISEISDYSSLKSVNATLANLHAGVAEILQPVLLESSKDFGNSVDISKLCIILQPIRELQQSLSVLDVNSIPIFEQLLEIPSDKLYYIIESISQFKEHLTNFSGTVIPALELADDTIEISCKVTALREVCTNLLEVIKCASDMPNDIGVKEKIETLEETLSNLLGVTNVLDGIKIEEVKNTTSQLHEKLLIVQEEIIKYVPEPNKKLSEQIALTQSMINIEQLIASLEQYEFVDLSHTSDITSCTSPQMGVELQSESLVQFGEIVERVVNVIQNCAPELINEDSIMIENFLQTCRNEIYLIKTLLITQPSHKKIIRLLQEFLILRNMVHDFTAKNDLLLLNLPDNIKLEFDVFVDNIEKGLQNIQRILVNVVNTQSELLFNKPLQKLDNLPILLKRLQEGGILNSQVADNISSTINCIGKIKSFLVNTQEDMVTELENVTNHKKEEILIDEIMGKMETIIENSRTLSFDDKSKKLWNQILCCLHQHQSYKAAKGTVKLLVLLKCFSDLTNILTLFVHDNDEKLSSMQEEVVFKEKVCLEKIVTEILEPLEVLHGQLSKVQEQILSGVEEDVTSIDITSTESLMNTVTEIQKEIQELEQIQWSEEPITNEEKVLLLAEVDKEIHTIKDTIHSISNVRGGEAVTEITEPIENIDKYLHKIIALTEFDSESDKILNKDKAPDIIKHLNQYAETIKILEENSTALEMESLRNSLEMVQILKDSIIASESVSFETSEALDLKSYDTKDQVKLAHELQAAITIIKVNLLQSERQLTSILGSDVYQLINHIISQLQSDLVVVYGAQIASQAQDKSEINKSFEANEIISDEILMMESKDIEKSMNTQDDLQIKNFLTMKISTEQVASEASLSIKHSDINISLDEVAVGVSEEPNTNISSEETSVNIGLSENSAQDKESVSAKNQTISEVAEMQSEKSLLRNALLDKTQEKLLTHIEIFLSCDFTPSVINDIAISEGEKPQTSPLVLAKKLLESIILEQKLRIENYDDSKANISFEQTKIAEQLKVALESLYYNHLINARGISSKVTDEKLQQFVDVLLNLKKDIETFLTVNIQPTAQHKENILQTHDNVAHTLQIIATEQLDFAEAKFNEGNSKDKPKLQDLPDVIPILDTSLVKTEIENIQQISPIQLDADESSINKSLPSDFNLMQDECMIGKFESENYELEQDNFGNLTITPPFTKDVKTPENSEENIIIIEVRKPDTIENVSSKNDKIKSKYAEISSNNVQQIIENKYLLQHLDDLMKMKLPENFIESDVTNIQSYAALVKVAEELFECLTELQDFDSTEPKSKMLECDTKQAKLAFELSNAINTFRQHLTSPEILGVANSKIIEKVLNALENVQSNLTLATSGEVGSPQVYRGEAVQKVNSIKTLDNLLGDLSSKINLLSSSIAKEDADFLKDILDEIQTVIIRLKRDYDSTANDTLNETLEDLECSVRSVQLQINENCPPELLKEACGTLQLLVKSIDETQSANTSLTSNNDFNSDEALQKCSASANDAVELLEIATKLDDAGSTQLALIISRLEELKNTVKSLKSCFVGNTEDFIDKGILIVKNLSEMEDKVFSLERDLDSEKSLSPSERDCVLTAVHSVYGNISNMRGTVSSIQKQYMHENYGRPSENILHSLKNISAICEMDRDSVNNPKWINLKKSLRKVFNHFEDIKFYINLDKTARLPNDTNFTIIILEELKTCLSDVATFDELKTSLDAIKKVNDAVDFVENVIMDISSHTTLEVKEKVPIFKTIAFLCFEASMSIISALKNEASVEYKDNVKIEKIVNLNIINEQKDVSIGKFSSIAQIDDILATSVTIEKVAEPITENQDDENGVVQNENLIHRFGKQDENQSSLQMADNVIFLDEMESSGNNSKESSKRDGKLEEDQKINNTETDNHHKVETLNKTVNLDSEQTLQTVYQKGFSKYDIELNSTEDESIKAKESEIDDTENTEAEEGHHKSEKSVKVEYQSVEKECLQKDGNEKKCLEDERIREGETSKVQQRQSVEEKHLRKEDDNEKKHIEEERDDAKEAQTVQEQQQQQLDKEERLCKVDDEEKKRIEQERHKTEEVHKVQQLVEQESLRKEADDKEKKRIEDERIKAEEAQEIQQQQLVEEESLRKEEDEEKKRIEHERRNTEEVQVQQLVEQESLRKEADDKEKKRIEDERIKAEEAQEIQQQQLVEEESLRKEEDDKEIKHIEDELIKAEGTQKVQQQQLVEERLSNKDDEEKNRIDDERIKTEEGQNVQHQQLFGEEHQRKEDDNEKKHIEDEHPKAEEAQIVQQQQFIEEERFREKDDKEKECIENEGNKAEEAQKVQQQQLVEEENLRKQGNDKEKKRIEDEKIKKEEDQEIQQQLVEEESLRKEDDKEKKRIEDERIKTEEAQEIQHQQLVEEESLCKEDDKERQYIEDKRIKAEEAQIVQQQQLVEERLSKEDDEEKNRIDDERIKTEEGQNVQHEQLFGEEHQRKEDDTEKKHIEDEHPKAEEAQIVQQQQFIEEERLREKDDKEKECFENEGIKAEEAQKVQQRQLVEEENLRKQGDDKEKKRIEDERIKTEEAQEIQQQQLVVEESLRKEDDKEKKRIEDERIKTEAQEIQHQQLVEEESLYKEDDKERQYIEDKRIKTEEVQIVQQQQFIEEERLREKDDKDKECIENEGIKAVEAQKVQKQQLVEEENLRKQGDDKEKKRTEDESIRKEEDQEIQQQQLVEEESLCKEDDKEKKRIEDERIKTEEAQEIQQQQLVVEDSLRKEDDKERQHIEDKHIKAEEAQEIQQQQLVVEESLRKEDDKDRQHIEDKRIKAEEAQEVQQQQLLEEECLRKEGDEKEKKRIKDECIKEEEDQKVQQQQLFEEERLRKEDDKEKKRIEDKRIKTEEAQEIQQRQLVEEETLRKEDEEGKKRIEDERIKAEEAEAGQQKQLLEEERLCREDEKEKNEDERIKTEEAQRVQQQQLLEEERLHKDDKEKQCIEDERLKTEEAQKVQQQQLVEEDSLRKEEDENEKKCIEDERIKAEEAEKLLQQLLEEERLVKEEDEKDKKRIEDERIKAEAQKVQQEQLFEEERLRKEDDKEKQCIEDERIKPEAEKLQQQQLLEEEHLRKEDDEKEKKRIGDERIKAEEDQKVQQQQQLLEEERLRKQDEKEKKRIEDERIKAEEAEAGQQKQLLEEERLRREDEKEKNEDERIKTEEAQRVQQQQLLEEERLRKEDEKEKKRIEDERIKAEEAEKLQQQKLFEEERLRKEVDVKENKRIEDERIKAEEDQKVLQQQLLEEERLGKEDEKKKERNEDKRIQAEEVEKLQQQQLLEEERLRKEEDEKEKKRIGDERIKAEEDQKVQQQQLLEEERLRKEDEKEKKRIEDERIKAEEAEKLQQQQLIEEERLRKENDKEKQHIEDEHIKAEEAQKVQQQQLLEEKRLRKEDEKENKRIEDERIKAEEAQKVQQEQLLEEKRLRKDDDKGKQHIEDERIKAEKAEKLQQQQLLEEEPLRKEDDKEKKLIEDNRIKTQEAQEIQQKQLVEEQSLRKEDEEGKKRIEDVCITAEEAQKVQQQQLLEEKGLRKEDDKDKKRIEDECLKTEKAEKVQQQQLIDEERLRKEDDKEKKIIEDELINSQEAQEIQQKQLLEEECLRKGEDDKEKQRIEDERIKTEKAQKFQQQKLIEEERLRKENEKENQRIEDERIKAEEAENFQQQQLLEEESLRKEEDDKEKNRIEDERIKAEEAEKLQQQKLLEEERLRKEEDVKEKKRIEDERIKAEEAQKVQQQQLLEEERLRKKDNKEKQHIEDERIKAKEAQKLQQQQLVEEEHLRKEEDNKAKNRIKDDRSQVEEAQKVQQQLLEEKRLRKEEDKKEKKCIEDERIKAEAQIVQQQQLLEIESLRKEEDNKEKKRIEDERIKKEEAQNIQQQQLLEEKRLRKEEDEKEKKCIEDERIKAEAQKVQQQQLLEIESLRKEEDDKEKKRIEDERIKKEEAQNIQQQQLLEEERLCKEDEKEKKRIEDERIKAEEAEKLQQQKLLEEESLRKEEDDKEKKRIEDERIKAEEAEKLQQQKLLEEERLRKEEDVKEKNRIEDERIKAEEAQKVQQQQLLEEERLRKKDDEEKQHIEDERIKAEEAQKLQQQQLIEEEHLHKEEDDKEKKRIKDDRNKVEEAQKVKQQQLLEEESLRKDEDDKEKKRIEDERIKTEEVQEIQPRQLVEEKSLCKEEDEKEKKRFEDERIQAEEAQKVQKHQMVEEERLRKEEDDKEKKLIEDECIKTQEAQEIQQKQLVKEHSLRKEDEKEKKRIEDERIKAEEAQKVQHQKLLEEERLCKEDNKEKQRIKDERIKAEEAQKLQQLHLVEEENLRKEEDDKEKKSIKDDRSKVEKTQKVQQQIEEESLRNEKVLKKRKRIEDKRSNAEAQKVQQQQLVEGERLRKEEDDKEKKRIEDKRIKEEEALKIQQKQLVETESLRNEEDDKETKRIEDVRRKAGPQKVQQQQLFKEESLHKEDDKLKKSIEDERIKAEEAQKIQQKQLVEVESLRNEEDNKERNRIEDERIKAEETQKVKQHLVEEEHLRKEKEHSELNRVENERNKKKDRIGRLLKVKKSNEKKHIENECMDAKNSHIIEQRVDEKDDGTKLGKDNIKADEAYKDEKQRVEDECSLKKKDTKEIRKKGEEILNIREGRVQEEELVEIEKEETENQRVTDEFKMAEKVQKLHEQILEEKHLEKNIINHKKLFEKGPNETELREVANGRKRSQFKNKYFLQKSYETNFSLLKDNESDSSVLGMLLNNDLPCQDVKEPDRFYVEEDKDKKKFIDTSYKNYEMEFQRPSSYTERTTDFISRPLFEKDTCYGKNHSINKAQSLIYEAKIRSLTSQESVSTSSEPRDRRSDIRHRSKALSEAKSVTSNLKKGITRDVKRKPVFSTYLTDRTAVEGSRVKLTCSAITSSDPKITWYKNGLVIDDKSKYKTRFIDGLITLEVLNAVPSDSAQYSCTVENDNGSINTSAALKVYPSFEASPIPPTFTRSIRDTYHLAENELVLECRIRGQPLPTIKWLKDGKPITSNERYQTYYLAEGVCRLAITSPVPEDSGNYTCKAENSMWSDQISHIVYFTGRESRLSPNLITLEKSRFNRQVMESRRPHFTNILTDYNVASGGTIGLQVEVMGAPTKVEWLRDGRSVMDAYKNARTFVEHGLYTLSLSDVTERESGTYTCRAWSTHGNVDMNAAIKVIQPNEMDGKPAIIIGRPDKDALISIGEDLNISFRVQGEPKPKVIFMKGTRDITASQRVCKMTSDDYVKFTLKRSTISDAGTYCILARNSYGCDRAFVTVVVRQRATSENLISDWLYPIDDLALPIDRSHKAVPGRIPGEPTAVDGGNNWVSLAWPKPNSHTSSPVLAYKVESWLIGKDGGARWVELGVTPLNSFDAFNLKQGEEYHFRVTPKNRYGWGESAQTSSPIGIGIAGDRPEFNEILPGQLKALVGATANLNCSVTGKPIPEVVWMKNGHEIEEESTRITMFFNGHDCNLTIKDISVEDEARYSCEATNVHGRASTYARLAVVTDKLVWEADAKLKRERSSEAIGEYPPQFTMRLRDRRVQATYPVRLTCQVVGSPPPIVTWYKNGEEIVLDSRRSMSQDEQFHTLEIAPTSLEDGGVYEAMARNGSGAVSCRCNLVVDKGIRAYLAPEFCCGLEPLYRLSEGDELRITAVVEAYPSVGVTWYRDGVRLRPSRRAVMTLDRDGQIELALASVTPREAGVYTCTASNEVGKASTSGKVEVIKGDHIQSHNTPPIIISSDVPYSKEPMFIRKPRSSEAYEGDTVIIECEVIGDPKPDVFWLRDFLKPDYYRDASHFKRVGDGPEHRFEIPHAKLDYTGAYSVVARNVHGEAKAVISLQILAKDPSSSEEIHNVRYSRIEVIPQFEKMLTDLLCHDGDAIEFECQVNGNPEPDIRWYHYTELIRQCSDFEMTYDGGTARLKIKQVTAEDEGSYKCEAFNNLGKAVSTACLVVYPPGEPNTLSQRLRRPPALHSAASTPRSTPRTTPARSLSRNRTPGPASTRLSSPSRQMPPKFYTYPYNKVVEEGETVVFKCAVKGLPSPWATWDKDGEIVTPSARVTIKEKDDILRVLEIEDVTIEDVGLYRITVENHFGRAEAVARLEVISHKGKFYAGVRSYSASPSRSSLSYRRRLPSSCRQD